MAFSQIDVEIEPLLEPKTSKILKKTTNTNDNARVDIAARSVFIKGQHAYFDASVFNPLAHKYRDLTLKKAYERNEQEKKSFTMKESCRSNMDPFCP